MMVKTFCEKLEKDGVLMYNTQRLMRICIEFRVDSENIMEFL